MDGLTLKGSFSLMTEEKVFSQMCVFITAVSLGSDRPASNPESPETQSVVFGRSPNLSEPVFLDVK